MFLINIITNFIKKLHFFQDVTNIQIKIMFDSRWNQEYENGKLTVESLDIQHSSTVNR